MKFLHRGFVESVRTLHTALYRTNNMAAIRMLASSLAFTVSPLVLLLSLW